MDKPATLQLHPRIARRSGVRTNGRAAVDAVGLARALRRRIAGEVRFDEGSRALYATDGSNYRQVPIGVVLPKSIDDVVATVSACREFGAPILGRGCGTSLAGQCCNVAVVIDMSKYMNSVLEIDADRRIARVQPGVILDDLRAAAAPHGLTFGPDPATHNHCTLGGMIGNNSCGSHSVMAAFAGTGPRTSDNVASLEILTYDGSRMSVGPTSDEDLDRVSREPGRRGEIYSALRALRDRHAEKIRSSFPNIPRRVSGYNLPQLLPESGFNVASALVGTESTCVIVLEATVKLISAKPARSLLVLGYPDLTSAADAVPSLLDKRPIALEGIDDRLVLDLRDTGLHPDGVRLLPEGKAWLLVEFEADDAAAARNRGMEVMASLRGGSATSMRLLQAAEASRIWEVRESALAATAHVAARRPTWPGWEDSAVPPERLGDYLRDLRHLLEEFEYDGALYGHFGQGCVHTRIDFDLMSEPGIRKFRAFLRRAAELVTRYGGSCSGEHGDGQARGELLSIMYPPEIVDAFRDFKRIWDPEWKMNPGKVIDGNPVDAELRLGAHFHDLEPGPSTHLRFPEEQGRFPRVAIRCVGVGECRRHDGGTMCPSFMVTREEKHCTRGRARLLFEMVRGDVLRDGWQSEAVKDALDLCLACKGCKGDCPVHVDMAAYKAEFLSHYFKRHRRTRSDYALGWIHKWARLAGLAPGLANFATQAPLLRDATRFAAGITQRRMLPPFAERTFVDTFRARSREAPGRRPRVLLWPDTFNNAFYPAILEAAVDVLETAGYAVEIPPTRLCCGRPLYYFGMLDEAKRLLSETMDALRPAIEAGVPLVGVEPSCISTFRDELHNFFPDDPLARKLRDSAHMFSDFLCERPGALQWPALDGQAVVHEHCHRKSVLKGSGVPQILHRIGLEVVQPDTGCCGLAGPFGFERDHYDVSMRIGERVLLPLVRDASHRTLIVADGFACREQIRHATGRRALHPAEVIRLAMDRPAGVATGGDWERLAPHTVAAQPPLRALALIGGVVAGVIAARALARD